jgi:hypothetical protein
MNHLTLSEYIRRLQDLEQLGHGELPLGLCTEDGWVAMSKRNMPYVASGDFEDDSSTAHSWRRGPYIVV